MSTRRFILGWLGLGAVAVPVTVAVAAVPSADLSNTPRTTKYRFLVSDPQNMGDLIEWAHALPNQQMGRPLAICETGHPYEEFFCYGMARPSDVSTIEREVAREMYRKLADYFGWRHGRIYWRIPIEFEIHDYPVVTEYREDGPDIDFVTDKCCVKDHDWKRVAVYCRVHCADA